MILELALLAGALLIGGGLLAEYWDSVKNWLKRAADHVARMIAGVVFGVRYFVQRVGEQYKQISRNYSKNKQHHWEETIVTRMIPVSQVPREILAEARYTETDQTRELRKLLA